MRRLRAFAEGLWTVAIIVSFIGVPGVLIGRWISREAAQITPYLEDFVFFMSWVATVGIIVYTGSSEDTPEE